MNSIIQKPWGTYQVLDQNKNYLTKKIIVKPNGKLSLQSHNHRSEHWIVVEGAAEVLINDKIRILKTNESIFIPKQSKHSLTNNHDNDLVLIEIWYGDFLDEEDIIRFKDIYGRV